MSTVVGPKEMEFRLHSKQLEFYRSNALYRGFVGGIGSGKSFVGAFDLITKSVPGALHAVVAPTYRLLADATLRSFMDVARALDLWDDAAYRKTDNTAMLKDGSEFLFRSGDDPGKLRGPNLRAGWLDECSQMKEEVFSVMIGRLRWGGRQGTLSGTFTPSGREHWTYRVFGDVKNPNVTLVQCSTRDNPFVDRQFYDNLLLQYGKGEGGILRAQQELEGQFVCVEGAEWGPECFSEDLWFTDWPESDDAIRVVNLDSSKGIGGKTGDDSVFAEVMFHDGLLWVEFNMNNTRNASQISADAIEIQKAFRPDFFGIEEEFGGHVLADDLAMRAEAEDLLMPIVLVPTRGLPKDVRIRCLTPYLTRKMFRFRRTEQTVRGVQCMESWPHSEHDDAPDALEGAIRIINESGLITAA